MKRVLVALSMSMLAGTAFAADLGSQAAPAPVVVKVPYQWSGFYFGVNSGLGFGDGNVNASANDGAKGDAVYGPTIGTNEHGFLAGGQVGYNAQFNQFVMGVEGDFDWAHIMGANNESITIAPKGPPPFTIGVTGSERLNYLSTVRARLGYSFTPVFMLYGTGGLAIGEVGESYGAGFTGAKGYDFSGNATKYGWVAGVGAEYALSDKLSVKSEYLHYDLGTESISLPGLPAPWTANAWSKMSGDIGRVGINYKLFP